MQTWCDFTLYLQGHVSCGVTFLSLPCKGGRDAPLRTYHLFSGASCRLGDCGLTAAGCQDLASALISNQRLTHLYLSTNNLGSEGVNLLCRALKLFSCALRRLMWVNSVPCEDFIAWWQIVCAPLRVGSAEIVRRKWPAMCYILSQLVTSYISHFLGKCYLCICIFSQREVITHPHRVGSHEVWQLAVSYKVTEHWATEAEPWSLGEMDNELPVVSAHIFLNGSIPHLVLCGSV